MSTILDLLSGEIERLFSSAEMKDLCVSCLGIEPAAHGIEDAAKSVFAKKITELCERDDAVEALADAVVSLKKSAVDPRLRQILNKGLPQEDLKPGTVVDGYTVESRVGENDIGIVYACARPESGQRYLLTALRRDRAENRRAARRYLMLMRLLKNDPIPSVVSVKEAGLLEDGRPYAISAAIEGDLIAEHLPVSPLQALKLLEGILDAVEALHGRGIVHANLNAGNIHLLGAIDEEEAEVVLSGLGADRLVSPASPAVGIAPEMLRLGRADVRTDIYALGALLYEMVAGSPMFSGKLPVDIAAAHLVRSVPAVSEASDDPSAAALDKFIAHLTAKDPAKRPKDVDFVRRKLEDVRRSVEQLELQSKVTGAREDIALQAERFLQSPTDPEALDALLAGAGSANAWGAAVEVLEEAAASSDDPAVVGRLMSAAADTAFRRLKDYSRALSIYEYLLNANPEDAESAAAVLDVLDAAGRYEELIEKLAGRAELLEDPAERLGLFRRIATVYEKKLKNFESALGYYLACLTGTAADAELMDTLENLTEATGQYENLAASLGQAAQVAEGAGDGEAALLFYEKLGRIYLHKLEQPGYALTCLQKVLQYRPDDMETLEAMAELYRTAQQWPELAQVTLSLAEKAPQPTLRRKYTAEAADIFYKRIGDAEQALSLLDTVLAEEPGHRGALDTMTAIFEATQDFTRLASMLNDSLQSISDPAEQVDVRVRLGDICENKLSDIAAAKVHYEEAAKLSAECSDALKGLERIYLKEGNTLALKDNLEAQLACSMSPKQQSEIRVRLADLYEEEFKEYKKAAEHLEKVVASDDTHRYALLTLTRLYRRGERWEDLVNILEKRAAQAGEEEKKELLKERADVIRDKLKDASRAIQALAEVSSLGVDDALENLAKAQEDSGDFEAALGTLNKVAEAAQDAGAKQSVMLRVAALELDKMGDVDAAVSTLRTAKELNPANQAVLSLLSRAVTAKRNFAEALGILELQASLAESAPAKADILATMGSVCMDELNDKERAVMYFRQSVSLDESNFSAAFKLLKIYREINEIEEAIPLYRRWAYAADTADSDTRVELFTNMGETYAAAERLEDAYKAFSRAVSVEGVSVSPELMLRFAQAGFERDAFDEVEERLGTYLKAMSGSLSDEAQAPLLIQLARAYLKQDNHIDAHKYLKQVLSASPSNLDARALLADVHEKRGDYRQMAESLKECIAAMPDTDERKVELLRRAGAVTAEQLRDTQGGINLLKQALDLNENDRATLAELLKVYTAAKNFNELVGVILRIADLVEEPEQKVRYYISAAKVYRREIGNINKAVHYFEKALDINPQDPDANRAIVDTLEQNMAWDKLELHYKKLIARMPKDATKDDKLIVYKPFFELLSKKLKKKSDAAVIGDAVFKLNPDDEAHAEHLAELYGWDLEYAPKAVELHRSLLEKNTARADSLRQLYRIFSAQRDPDKTWCAASVLSLLNACTPEEHRYYKDYRPSDLQSFTNVLDETQWTKRLFPKNMDRTVTSIFSIIQDAIFKAKGQPLSRYGLDLSQAVDVTQSQYTASAFVNFAAGTLGLTPPPFFFLQGAAPGFQVLETAPPVLVSDGDEQSLTDRVGTAFLLGQQIALFYPGLFVSQMATSGTEMLSWLLASIRMFVPTMPVPDDIAGQISDKLTPLRSSLDDFAMERLQGHVHTFVSTSSAEVNLKKWSKAVCFTQDRAGLLLCGDLSAAVKMLRERVQDEKQLADRLRAITLFAISEEHFELRAHLGAALRSA